MQEQPTSSIPYTAALAVQGMQYQSHLPECLIPFQDLCAFQGRFGQGYQLGSLLS